MGKSLTTIIEEGGKEFDKEINDDYLRGASTGKQLIGIKSFLAQQQTIAYEAGYLSANSATGAYQAGFEKAIEEVREKIKTLLIKDEEMPIGTDFRKCDAYNDGINKVLASLNKENI